MAPARYYGWELNKWFPDYERKVASLINNLLAYKYSGIYPGTKNYSFKNNIYYASPMHKENLAEIFKDFIFSCIHDLLLKHNKEIFIEDNTWNILFAKELQDIMPEFKLIHIIRDPRDVVTSLIKQRWAPSELKQAVTFYKDILKKWISIKSQINNCLEIKLEDLVKQSENELSNICRFSEISFHKDMLKIDLSKANSGRWKKEITTQHQEYLRENLADLVAYYGY